MTREEARQLVPDTVPRHRTTPEQLLMSAVLDDAIAVYQNRRINPCRRRRELREVVEWFLSFDCQWPFAFRNVCDALGLDPDAVWERLSGAGWRPDGTLGRGPAHAPVRMGRRRIHS